MIAGVLSLDECWSPHCLAAELAKSACRYPTLEARRILDDRRVACYRIKRRDQNDPEIRASLAENVDVIAFGELGCSQRSQQILEKEISSQGIVRLFDQSGLWIGITYDRVEGRLSLAVDPLGVAWVYIARFKHGYIFCNDFGALVSNYPEAVTPDMETILTMLAMGYTPDEKTCFENITVLPPGSLVELRSERLHTVFKRRIEYGDRYVSLSTQQKYELLDSVYDRTAQDWFQADSEDFVVSFSGGYDSRYGLAMLNKRRIPTRCLTFGNPRNHEVQYAQTACEQLNCEASVYEISRTSWEGWKRCVQQVGAIGGSHQWAGWVEEWLTIVRNGGSKVLIGYLGDAFSGKHLARPFSNKRNWLDEWETWSLEEGWAGSLLLHPEATRRMRHSVRQRLEEASRQANYAFPHQVAMHLDWYGRQRRFVASQPNMIVRFLFPVIYFYTCYGMEFWSNLSMDDLEDQKLYISYAASRFPDLFFQPKPATLGERFRGAAKNLLVGLLPSLKNFIAPREVNNGKLIAQNYPYFVHVVEEVLPVLDEFLDTRSLVTELRAYPKTAKLNAAQLLRLVNLSILLNLRVDSHRVRL
jgi:hypothetical protein